MEWGELTSCSGRRFTHQFFYVFQQRQLLFIQQTADLIASYHVLLFKMAAETHEAINDFNKTLRPWLQKHIGVFLLGNNHNLMTENRTEFIVDSKQTNGSKIFSVTFNVIDHVWMDFNHIMQWSKFLLMAHALDNKSDVMNIKWIQVVWYLIGENVHVLHAICNAFLGENMFSVWPSWMGFWPFHKLHEMCRFYEDLWQYDCKVVFCLWKCID